jgi:uncharacterized protein YjbJ (UPF0337 family)
MDENRISGSARNFGGKVQEGVGRLTGDTETEAKGALNQAIGSAQNIYGQAKDTASDAADAIRGGAVKTKDVVGDFIVQRPYTMVALALAAGWVVARMGRRDGWHI